MTVINPPERRLAKRISVQWIENISKLAVSLREASEGPKNFLAAPKMVSALEPSRCSRWKSTHLLFTVV